MALDVKGSLKNTKINLNPYVVVDELVSNAVDSFLIRKSSDRRAKDMEISIAVDIYDKIIGENEAVRDLRITCTDNGAGLGDSEMKAFVTKDTSFKDYLNIAGIGKCKGSGRIQFLHYFSNLEINSVFLSESGNKSRSLKFEDGQKEIEQSSFKTSETLKEDLETSVSLDGLKDDIYERVYSTRNIELLFSANTLKTHVLVSFLQRFVSLKAELGDFSIKISSKYKEDDLYEELKPSDLPQINSSKEIEVYGKNPDGSYVSTPEIFSVSSYKLNKLEFNLKSNNVALCAKSSPVKFITNRYLKTKVIENKAIDGQFHIVLIESTYFDDHVNEQRDDFDIVNELRNQDAFRSGAVSWEDIYDHLDEYVLELLSPPDWSKDEIVAGVTNKFGISQKMIANSKVRVIYGDSEETVVERVLASYQKEIIKDTSEIFDITQEIANAEPHTEDYRRKINDLAWKYTASLKTIDMANLSQVVVRRAAILKILEMATKEQLNTQQKGSDERKNNEEIIHSIFFPMRKDSVEAEDHDIWILNEEYNYYDYVASDKKLSSISWQVNEPLFDPSVDEELEILLDKNYKDNHKKRPDIAIFSSEGSAIIVEFKSIGVSMDNHVGDLMEYAQLLSAKSKGRLKKFYGYLIGSEVNANRLTSFTQFPSGQGHFGTFQVKEPNTNTTIAELYSEILFYGDIVERAKKRLNVYKDRLQLNLD